MKPHPLTSTRLRKHMLIALLTGLTLSATANLTAQSVTSADSTKGTPSIHPSQWPNPAWPFAHDAALERKVDTLLASMTLEEKVAQTIQADIGSITPDEHRQ